MSARDLAEPYPYVTTDEDATHAARRPALEDPLVAAVTRAQGSDPLRSGRTRASRRSRPS
ncbi:hypothetical protein ABT063_35490 [Streptomyces sp. NPDC002838]|uniref:hypothetical protein n=1 Tax=Streptomyces sp. NPDC002838 TaxID=3154436 RepID=UPI00332B35F8